MEASSTEGRAPGHLSAPQPAGSAEAFWDEVQEKPAPWMKMQVAYLQADVAMGLELEGVHEGQHQREEDGRGTVG